MVAENDSLLGLDDSAVENRDPLTGGISLTSLEDTKNILQVSS